MQIETLDWLRTAEGARLLVDATRAETELSRRTPRRLLVQRRQQHKSSCVLRPVGRGGQYAVFHDARRMT